jgi:hypothetical protein
MTEVVRPAWRIAVFLALLIIVLALVEARLGRGEPQCGFSPLLGGRQNVFWCGVR